MNLKLYLKNSYFYLLDLFFNYKFATASKNNIVCKPGELPEWPKGLVC